MHPLYIKSISTLPILFVLFSISLGKCLSLAMHATFKTCTGIKLCVCLDKQIGPKVQGKSFNSFVFFFISLVCFRVYITSRGVIPLNCDTEHILLRTVSKHKKDQWINNFNVIFGFKNAWISPDWEKKWSVTNNVVKLQEWKSYELKRRCSSECEKTHTK